MPKITKKAVKEDLSRYTVGSSGSAPAMIEQAEKVAQTNKESESTQARLADKVDLNEIPLEVRNKRLYIFGIVLTLVIVISTSALFYFRANLKNYGVSEIIKVETVDTDSIENIQSTKEVTPESLKRSEITLEVLNGSGVFGEATRVADIFKSLGYEIVIVGNTDRQDDTELFVSKEFEERVEALLEDVENKLDIKKSSGELKDSTASGRIIIGK